MPTIQAPGTLQQLPPLSLYVHVPWCVRKCPYCDFNSHALRDGFDEMRYVAALLRDLESDLPSIWGRSVQTIFIGGGTPSLLSAGAMHALLDGLRARLRLSPEAEITLEANPGTAEQEKFREFRAAGITRLSLGIQSFHDAHLQALGRIHNSNEAQRAIDLAMRHFDRVNLDIMYALPQQTLNQALDDIEQAIASGVSHLSAYHLTLEPNTRFAHQPPPGLPDDDNAADMQTALEQRLAAAGYQHYETSAFARPGQQCRHNLNYWLFGDYLGIGAGAHGKLSFHDHIERSMRHKQPAAYLDAAERGDARQTRHNIARDDLAFEFMMNALRLTDGFAPALFNERTGLTLAAVDAPLRRAEQQGLIEYGTTLIRPTLRGQRFLNDLLELFLPD